MVQANASSEPNAVTLNTDTVRIPETLSSKERRREAPKTYVRIPSHFSSTLLFKEFNFPVNIGHRFGCFSVE